MRDCYPDVTSLRPSAFSKTCLCGSNSSSSSSSRMSPMLAEGARRTNTQVLARARACVCPACISFAQFYVDAVVLQGSQRRTVCRITKKLLANSSCLACLQRCSRAQVAYPSVAKFINKKMHFRKVLRVESRFVRVRSPVW